MNLKTSLVGLVLVLSSCALRAQLIDPVVSPGLNGSGPYQPGQTFSANTTIGGTRYNAQQTQTFDVGVYFSAVSDSITAPAIPLGSITATLPGGQFTGPVATKSFTTPTTFAGSPITAGQYYLVFRLPGTQSTAIKSVAFSVVIADISVEQPANNPLTDGVSTVAFGNVGIGQNNPLNFVVRNTGSATLSPLAANITGTNAGDFRLDAALPMQLAPGSTGFTLRYYPTSSGQGTAVLHITSNAPGAKSSFDINLTGTGVVLPSVTSYPPISIGRTSATFKAVINANGGSANANFYYTSGTAQNVRVAASPSVVSGTADTIVTYTVTGLSPGTACHYNIEGIKSGISIYGSGQNFTTYSTNLEAWRQQYYPGSTATTGPGADLNEPLKDGVCNLLKFATGLNPTKSGVQPVAYALQGGSFSLTFTPSPDAIVDGIVYSIEYTSDLSAGTWSSVTVSPSALGAGGTPVTVTVPASTSGVQTARLRVTRP